MSLKLWECADSSRLAKAEKNLLDNGGIILTSITDPRLTHIIMDDDDSIRYAELVRKTAKPRMKHIVLPSWVDECIEEETLMNEAGKSILGYYSRIRADGIRT